MDERQPTDDLAQFMDSYAGAWNTGDLDRIAGAYATPCFVVKGGRVLRHQDQAAKRRYFGDLLAGNGGGRGRTPGASASSTRAGWDATPRW